MTQVKAAARSTALGLLVLFLEKTPGTGSTLLKLASNSVGRVGMNDGGKAHYGDGASNDQKNRSDRFKQAFARLYSDSTR